ncbi:MAG: site-specific integrase [Pseudobutyrivibrio sp.]|nr:site-specific integrase [Pseudobutyrivibrio sp.]
MKKSGRITTGVVGNLLQQKGVCAMPTFDTSKTVKEGCEIWLYQHKQNSVKKGTFARLLTSFILMQRYSISETPICKLNTDCVQKYVNQLVRDGYALTTIRKQYNLITGYVRFLIGEGVPVASVFLNVNLPSEDAVQKHKEEVISYSKVEQKRISNACKENDGLAAWVVTLLIETGLRIGELLALKWEDIEWERRAVYVHKTLVNHNCRKTTVLQNSPKSKSSKRHVPLSQCALNLLERLFDESPSGSGFIFSLDKDHPDVSIGYPTCRTETSKLCKAASVEYHGFHIFRHTFATNCYYKGCDVKKLSKLLGHADVSVTYNTYIHLYGDDLEDLRSVVE